MMPGPRARIVLARVALARVALALVALALVACDAPPAAESGVFTVEAGDPCAEVGAIERCDDGETRGMALCLDAQVWSPCLAACKIDGQTRACDRGDGRDGAQVCFPADGHLLGSTCVDGDACYPGPPEACLICTLDEEARPVALDLCDEVTTPLVLAFDAAPTLTRPLAAAAFDLSGVGTCTAPDWPTAATPLLARDLDRSGTIDGGHELFGSATRLAAGGRADHGFQALADLDRDRDGAITPRDPAWSELLLWTDVDADRRSSGWELVPLAAHGVDALPLTFAVAPVCDDRGNCGRERAPFAYRRPAGARAIGEVIDLHLVCE